MGIFSSAPRGGISAVGPRECCRRKGGIPVLKGGSIPWGKGGSKNGGKGGGARGPRKWGVLALKALKTRGSAKKRGSIDPPPSDAHAVIGPIHNSLHHQCEFFHWERLLVQLVTSMGCLRSFCVVFFKNHR